MNENSKIIIPKSLLDLLNKQGGFSLNELIEITKLQEIKDFLTELKPYIGSLVSKEFPMFSIFFN